MTVHDAALVLIWFSFVVSLTLAHLVRLLTQPHPEALCRRCGRKCRYCR